MSLQMTPGEVDRLIPLAAEDVVKGVRDALVFGELNGGRTKRADAVLKKLLRLNELVQQWAAWEREYDAPPSEPAIEVYGLRIADNSRSVLVSLSREPSDGELRAILDCLRDHVRGWCV